MCVVMRHTRFNFGNNVHFRGIHPHFALAHPQHPHEEGFGVGPVPEPLPWPGHPRQCSPLCARINALRFFEFLVNFELLFTYFAVFEKEKETRIIGFWFRNFRLFRKIGEFCGRYSTKQKLHCAAWTSNSRRQSRGWHQIMGTSTPILRDGSVLISLSCVKHVWEIIPMSEWYVQCNACY